MSITEKLELLQDLRLPTDFAYGSFAATIDMLDSEQAPKIYNYLEYYGVRITKASEVKWYMLKDEELKILLTRLQYFKEHNIPVVDENGNNMPYVFDAASFKANFKDADLTNVIPDVFRDQITLGHDTINILDINATVGLSDEESLERYSKIDSVLTSVIECLPNAEYQEEYSNNIIKLMSATNLSDEEIILAVLVYQQNRSAEEIAQIRNIIGTINASLQGGNPTL